MSVQGISAEFHVGNRIEYDRVTTMIGEKAILESFLDVIKEDDVVWDVGANIGMYSVFGGLKATKGSVISFEPHPQNANRIKENISLNRIENVNIKRAALGAEDGSAQLYTHGDEVGGGQHSLVDHGDGVADVDLIQGDSVGGSTPNVIKIDVEGAELNVLDGMVETLPKDSCRVLFIEVHHEHGVSVDDVAERISTAGFTFDTIDERGGTTFLQATKMS